MSTFISVIGLMTVFALVLAIPIYLIELRNFAEVMAREHPDLVGVLPRGSGGAYDLLRAIGSGKLDISELSPQALKAYKSARLLLHIAASLILALMLILFVDGALYEGRA